MSVNIKKRIQVKGNWIFAAIVRRDGEYHWDHFLVDGQVEEHKEGKYYIEWREKIDGKIKRIQRPAGAHHVDAIEAARIQEKVLDLRRDGIQADDYLTRQRVYKTVTTVIDQPLPTAETATIKAAIESFLAEKKVTLKASSYRDYASSLGRFHGFVQLLGKQTIETLTREDIMKYQGHLKDSNLGNTAVHRHGIILIGLLRHVGAKAKFAYKDLPEIDEVKRDIYDLDVWEKFAAVCTPDELVLFSTFLHTGFRDKEVRFLTWADVDFQNRVLRVSHKRHLGFTSKNYKSRKVTVPDELLDLLAAWKQRSASLFNPESLVFPSLPAVRKPNTPGRSPRNKPGTPRPDFLDLCKEIGFRAGLNCGRCITFEGCCKDRACCEHFYLHRFRHTFATVHLRSGVDVRTVQTWLGHSDLETTLLYLEPAEGEVARRAVSQGMLAREYALSGERRENVVQMPVVVARVEETPEENDFRAYDYASLQKFFAACSEDERVFFETILHTGFETAEIGFLMWSDVDFVNKTIKVQARSGFGPATKKRTIPVPSFLLELLDAWADRSAGKRGSMDFVFPAHTDRRLQCKQIAKRAGLCKDGDYSGWTLQRFRNTFASYHLRSGVDIRTVQYWLGHSDIRSTMAYQATSTLSAAAGGR